MVHPSPKPIALLLPVWNRQGKLDRALASLASDADLLEVVVIDDGSEPPVRIDAPPGLDVQLIRLPSNRGIATALNAGLAYAFGRCVPYIARLDSDDVALPGRFRRQLEFLERNPEIGICGGGYHECSVDGRLLRTVLNPQGDAAIRRGMHLRTTLWHPTVMMRGEVARTVGFFDPALACEDVEYFRRFLDVTRAANLPEPLIRYEVGGDDALTGTFARRRSLAGSLMRLKLRRPEPLDLLWWIGFLAAGSYSLGLNQHLTGWGDRLLRRLDRRGA